MKPCFDETWLKRFTIDLHNSGRDVYFCQLEETLIFHDKKTLVTKYFQAPTEILIKKKMREGLTKEEVWKDLIKKHVHL